MAALTPAYGDAGRSGAYQVSGVPRDPEVAWRFRTDESVWAAPALAAGLLVVVDQTGAVHALDAATGQVRWRHQYDPDGPDGPADGNFTTPAVWKDWLFINPGNSVCVHDLHTGEVIHRIEGGGWPTVHGDTLLVHRLNRDLRALSLPSLETAWTRMDAAPFSGWLDASPAISPDGTAYAALGLEGQRTDSGITAFEVATGDEVFAFKADDEDPCPLGDDGEDILLFGRVHPVVAEGLVWIPAERTHDEDCDESRGSWWVSAEVVGLDPGTGERRWLHRPDPGAESGCSGSVAVADGVVYFATYQDVEPAEGGYRLWAADVATGEARWTAVLPGGNAGAPVVAGGVVYVATYAGVVCAFDALTGQPRWSLDLGDGIDARVTEEDLEYGIYEEDHQAVLPADGMLYVRTAAGVVAVRGADGTRT